MNAKIRRGRSEDSVKQMRSGRSPKPNMAIATGPEVAVTSSEFASLIYKVAYN